ncbi:MAG: hypothetical protein Q9M36_01380 [Sulfurovum sp.]|nr:hypothetical protein [Sulfurovum sp.]
MIKKRILLSAVVIAVLTLPSVAEEVSSVSMAESNLSVVENETALLEEPEEIEEEESDIEISGYLKAEASVFTKSGSSLNPLAPHESGDIMKGEGTLKIFVNGSIGEESSFHAEIQAVGNTEGVEGYEFHRNYTQYDALRELYIDTTLGGWDLRLGKQQVVWGKADGVKFLDIINPTDYREWGQNTMEDSRIPLWMMVAEKDLGNNDSLQFVWVPDVGRINQIPGLYDSRTGDQGQPFVSLGTDAITGQYNGFVNIGRDMGRVASAFDGAFSGAFGIPAGNGILQGFEGLTVAGFTDNVSDVSGMISSFGGDPTAIGLPASGGPSGNQMLEGVIVQTGSTTNLSAGNTQFDYKNPKHMFEYMGDTTFATFNTFAGMKTSYRVDDISRDLQDHNFGVKYAKATDFGLNFNR